MQFQVGDRVQQARMIEGIYGAVGATGTVLAVVGTQLTINFDVRVPSGHSCGGVCPDGRGLWVSDHNDLVLIDGHGRTHAGSFGEFVRRQERLVAKMHPEPV